MNIMAQSNILLFCDLPIFMPYNNYGFVTGIIPGNNITALSPGHAEDI